MNCFSFLLSFKIEFFKREKKIQISHRKDDQGAVALFYILMPPSNVEVLVHVSLVSLKPRLVLVSPPAPLTPGLLVVVDLVGVGVQLHLVLEDLPTLGAGDSLGGGVHAVLVLPQGGPVPHLGKTDLALDWLDLVNVVDVIPGGQLPANRTDLLPVIPSLVKFQVPH